MVGLLHPASDHIPCWKVSRLTKEREAARQLQLSRQACGRSFPCLSMAAFGAWPGRSTMYVWQYVRRAKSVVEKVSVNSKSMIGCPERRKSSAAPRIRNHEHWRSYSYTFA